MCQRLKRRTWLWLFGGLLLTPVISAEEPAAPKVKDLLEQQEEVEAQDELGLTPPQHAPALADTPTNDGETSSLSY